MLLRHKLFRPQFCLSGSSTEMVGTVESMPVSGFGARAGAGAGCGRGARDVGAGAGCGCGYRRGAWVGGVGAGSQVQALSDP